MDNLVCISGFKMFSKDWNFISYWLIDHLGQDIKLCRTVGKGLNFRFPIRSKCADLYTQRILRSKASLSGDWSFKGGSRIFVKPKATRSVRYSKRSRLHASCNPFFMLHLFLLKLSFTVTRFMCLVLVQFNPSTLLKYGDVWILHTDECHWASCRWCWRFCYKASLLSIYFYWSTINLTLKTLPALLLTDGAFGWTT